MNIFNGMKKLFTKDVKELSIVIIEEEASKTMTVNEETHQGDEMVILSDKVLVDGKEVESKIHEQNYIDSTSSITIR